MISWMKLLAIHIKTNQFDGCTPQSWWGSRSWAQGWLLWSRFLWPAEPCRSIPKFSPSENCSLRCPSETEKPQRSINTRLHFGKDPKTQCVLGVIVCTCCCVRSAWITSTLMPSYTSSWKSSRARSMDCTNTSTGGRNPWQQQGQHLFNFKQKSLLFSCIFLQFLHK